MKKPYTIFISFLIVVSSNLYSQNKIPNCDVLKNGTFKYMDFPDTTAYIVIHGTEHGTEHNEYFKNSKYYIKSRIKWVNDCNYIMTMTDITVPDFPYEPGDKMNVQINKIEWGVIYYTSTVNGQNWPGKMKIISE